VSPRAKIREHEPLAPRTTLGLGGRARFLVEAESDGDLTSALESARARGLRVGVLGGGSNVVVPDSGFDGVVVAMTSRGVVVEPDGDKVRVRARAGEPWDAFVEKMVREGYQGLECLSGIPGLVGATPIQNVGAYGQEVMETITHVRVFERRTMKFVTLRSDECGFSYRDSRFKREPSAFVVTDVTFSLTPRALGKTAYAELQKKFGLGEGQKPTAQKPTLENVRTAVLTLRRAKSMVIDPEDPESRSAGSFFLNPIVTEAEVARITALAVQRGLVDQKRKMPVFPQEGGASKLAAGWLIENAGIERGMKRGSVAVSKAHALALVHHGGGTTRELLALADEVKSKVREAWGLELVREPVLFG
jgi:UDP-N-acetylmuramate dehydrogenase